MPNPNLSKPRDVERFDQWLKNNVGGKSAPAFERWCDAYAALGFDWGSMGKIDEDSYAGVLRRWRAPADFPGARRITSPAGTTSHIASAAHFLTPHKDYWGEAGALSEEEANYVSERGRAVYQPNGFVTGQALALAGYVKEIQRGDTKLNFHLLQIPEEELSPEERKRLFRLLVSRFQNIGKRDFQLKFVGVQATAVLAAALNDSFKAAPHTQGLHPQLSLAWSRFSKMRLLGGGIGSDLLVEYCVFDDASELVGVTVHGTATLNRCLIGAQSNVAKLTVKGNLRVYNSTLCDGVSLDRLKICDGDLRLDSVRIGVACTFRRASVSGLSAFHEVQFKGDSEFHYAEFAGGIECTESSIGTPNFYRSKIGGRARFVGTKFGNLSSFAGCAFSQGANFRSAEFGREFIFSEDHHPTLVSGVADFSVDQHKKRRDEEGVWAIEDARFDGCTFADGVDFSNREFVGRASFDNAVFVGPPVFYGASLHQGVSFIGAEFDGSIRSLRRRANYSTPAGRKRANKEFGELERAFRTLKLAMEGQRARASEANFHRLELLARRHRPSGRSLEGVKEVTSTEKLLSHLYERSSLFGERILWPVLWLFVLWGVSFSTYGLILGDVELGVRVNWGLVRDIIAFSGERTFVPFLGNDAGKYVHLGEQLPKHPLWVFGAELLHRLISIGLIFVFALSTRRRFQMD